MDQFLVMSLTSASVSTTNKTEQADLQSKVIAKLNELNEIDREVLELRHVDGFSLTEIAKILEVQYETIKKRYYRALKRIKDLLAERED